MDDNIVCESPIEMSLRSRWMELIGSSSMFHYSVEAMSAPQPFR